jgi:ADP-ribose pyrophosphatase
MEILGTESVLNLRWLKVFNRKFRHQNREGVWTFVSRRDEPQLHENRTKADAVLIVAQYMRGDEHCVILTSEYRVPIGAREISFPAGLIDKDETPEQAAVREFKEETGMDFEVIKVSPPNLYSSAGLSDESTQIVFGTATGTPNTSGNEGTEDIEVIVLPTDKIEDLLRDQKVAFSVKAWCLLTALLV